MHLESETIDTRERRRVYSCNFNRSAYMPLAWGCLRSYVETQPDLLDSYEFVQPFFLPEHTDTALDSVVNPSVFTASCYLWNFQKNMRILRAAKQRWPDVTIVVGGPHVPEARVADFLALHPYVDFVIHKEGEVPFSSLLRELLNDTPDFSSVPSLTWRDESGTVVRNPLGTPLPNEITAPSPWLSGLLQPSVDTARDAGYQPVVLWETNRGCPYSCTFCDWGSATLSKVRRFPDERLHAEIDYFSEQGVAAVMCCDANFGILPRDVQLAEHLVERHDNVGSPRKFVTSWAKNAHKRVFQISRMFAHAGMTNGTILAMQTGSEDVLREVKRSNMKIESYERMARLFHDDGIEAYTEVILGLPGESRDSFIRGLCKILRMGIQDDIMIYECAVLPNSELGSEESRQRYSLDTITRTYLPDDIELIEVVVSHERMSRADWVYMYLFGAVVQALHNRGLTRFLAVYLESERILSYEDFYRAVLDDALARPDSVLGAAIERARRLLQDYLDSDRIPNEGKVLSQPDMAAELTALLPDKEEWLIYEWCWARVQADLDTFLGELRQVMSRNGITLDEPLEELFRYQAARVSLLDPAASGGAEVFQHDWSRYFEDPEQGLRQELSVLRFERTVARLR